MSSDIVGSLELDKKCVAGKVIVAKEINRCDSSFLLSCVLNHCIRNKSALLILSTHNSLTHYQNIGLRMNYSIKKQIDSGIIQFYNIGEIGLNRLLSGEDISLSAISERIEEIINSMKENYNSVNIVLDGVSHLFDMHYTLKEVNSFCKDLIYFVKNDPDTFIILHCNLVEDDVTHVMANLVAHKAHTVLEIASLASGWSADVSGHLTIRQPGLKFDKEHMFTMELKSSKHLFKLFDRGVKLFAPGTVGQR